MQLYLFQPTKHMMLRLTTDTDRPKPTGTGLMAIHVSRARAFLRPGRFHVGIGRAQNQE